MEYLYEYYLFPDGVLKEGKVYKVKEEYDTYVVIRFASYPGSEIQIDKNMIVSKGDDIIADAYRMFKGNEPRRFVIIKYYCSRNLNYFNKRDFEINLCEELQKWT